MSRPRLIAVAVLAVIAVVSGLVALALGPATPSSSVPSAAGPRPGEPSPLPTPTDVAAGVDAGPDVDVRVGELEQRGFRRTYLVLAPRSVTPTTPLVVGLHGRNAAPGLEATRDGLIPYVARGQAVLVYPVGYQQAWNVDDGCCGLAVAYGLDDVEFVAMVVDAVRTELGLTGPTDLVGFSNGGRLAYAIACRDVRRYDAVATVAAVPTTPDCPQEQVPVPLFAGLALDDPELPTDDDPEPPTTVLRDLQTDFVDRNGCVGSPTVATAGDASVAVWTACDDGTVAQTVTWRTGGHTWPVAAAPNTPGAADLVWSFLDGVHRRAALAGG